MQSILAFASAHSAALISLAAYSLAILVAHRPAILDVLRRRVPRVYAFAMMHKSPLLAAIHAGMYALAIISPSALAKIEGVEIEIETASKTIVPPAPIDPKSSN